MVVLCADCGEPVHGNAILVDGLVYHRGHLRCSECLLAIDKFYYLLTHAELVAEPSPIVVLENDEISEGRRRKPIARPASSPGKKTIVCSRCKASGHPICAGCNEPVDETYITAMKQDYHLNCFLCAGCRKPFAGGEFRVLNGKPYDTDCYWGARLRNAMS